MKQRRWIVETTGEERPVKLGEQYLSNRGPDFWPCTNDSFTSFPILTCLEICLDHSLSLPCRYCEDIAEEYRQAMTDRKTMGD